MAVALALPRRLRLRSRGLRERFGPEYDRALETYGAPSRAERELMARAKRVRRFHLRDLSEADRARLSATWSEVQAHFVDEPLRAVQEANELIKNIMAARGYPEADFDQRVADLSVDHPDVVQHYRAARALAQGGAEGRNTEELRQAVIHFRALFAELAEAPAIARGRTLQHARA